MAASGYTPISLYYSTTASAAPTAGNLVSGELAINITDGKLYYKDNAGAVQTLAGKGGTGVVAGSNTQIQFNNNGVFGASANLTFDGSTLTTSSDVTPLSLNRSGAGTAHIELKQSGTVGSYLGTTGSNNMIFYNGSASELMRINNTGLGIGTSSPTVKLDVVGAIKATIASTASNNLRVGNSGSNFYFATENSAGGSFCVGSLAYAGLLVSDNAIQLSTTNGASVQATLDTSGNLGLGVIPSAWASTHKAIDIGANANISGLTSLNLWNNAYWNGTNTVYKTTGFATLYAQSNDGQHRWYYAASGTAGNTASFTQAMTLDASGQLGIGTTSPGYPLDVKGAVGAIRVQPSTNTNSAYSIFLNSGNALYFGVDNSTGSDFGSAYSASITTTGAYPLTFRVNNAERARIDSSGNLLVGTTSGSDKIVVVQSSASSASQFKNSSGTAAAQCVVAWHANTTGDNVFHQFFTEASATSRGSISYNRTAGLVAYNTTSDYRAKDITGPVENSGALIDSVPVYMGKMKGATQERPMFIAHETPAYAHTGEKDAVDADGNPVYQQMDASALIPVMWAEIQSLRARVAQLEAKGA